MTDAKDYHSAALVNRLVAEVAATSQVVEELVILQGNHDYLREGHAYFSFLNVLPGVRFVTQPTEIMLDDGPTACFMPHTKNPAAEWKGRDFSHYDLLFIHQTIKGAVASNGQEMDGEQLPELNAGKVWSGDIHVPQVIGPIEYIGSPYHVHFGDRFTPRVVLLDKRGRSHDIHFESIHRVTLQVGSLAELADEMDKLRPGDQVKLRVRLTQADKHEWPALKKEAAGRLKEAGVLVEGVELALDKGRRRFSEPGKGEAPAQRLSDPQVVERFIRAEGLTADALDVGLQIIES